MEIPIRLENAITKLYTAFHEDELDAYSCTACAVGNICNNSSDWSMDLMHNEFRLVINTSLEEFDFSVLIPSESVVQSGYSLFQLSKIEKIFLDIHRGLDMYNVSEKREAEFKGLCAVVEYLCELDNIPNVMDYTKLFETENEKPKYELQIK